MHKIAQTVLYGRRLGTYQRAIGATSYLALIWNITDEVSELSVNVILILTYIHLFKSAVRVKVQMWTCIKLILMYAPSKFNSIPLLRGWDQNEYAVNIVNIANEIQILASNYRLNILNMEWISVMLNGVPELARYPKKIHWIYWIFVGSNYWIWSK